MEGHHYPVVRTHGGDLPLQNNTLDKVSRKVFHHDRLDRTLERQHITGIAISGTIGIGIFVSSGEIISTAGSAGTVISYFVAGLIVIAVMRCLAELVSVRPLSGALIDYPHTFVDEALGFACGLIYWLGQCASMACMLSASASFGGHFNDSTSLSKGGNAGVIVVLLFVTLISNLIGVRTYGELERVFKWFKILLIIILCILMIVINANVGRERTGSWNQNYTDPYDFVPYLRPEGFVNVTDLESKPDDPSLGISGGRGQLASIWTATSLAIFACMGGDLVMVTAGEAKKPRADLPNAARFMYLVPLILYLLASFFVSLNINYTDPALYRPWSVNNEEGSHSAFIIIAKTTTFGALPNFLNACFIISGYTASNTALYVSSRTLFALAQQYGSPWIRGTLGKTNDGHTPVAAICCSTVFGLLAFLGMADPSFNQPLSSLSSFFVGGIACVYASQTIAFLRFKAGLDRLRRLDIYSRNGAVYKRNHFRARWQPTTAWFGLIGCILIAFTSGWLPCYLINSRDQLKNSADLKRNGLLVVDIVSSFSGPVLFICFYLGYKFAKGTRIRRTRDLTLDEYILPKRFPGEQVIDEKDAATFAQELRDLEGPRTTYGNPDVAPRTKVAKVIMVLKEAWSYMK